MGVTLGDWFSAELGSRQSDPISPLSFITLLECMMESADCNVLCKGVNTHEPVIRDLRFADDVDLLAEEETELQLLIDQVHASSEDCGLKINTSKSKVLVFKKRWRSFSDYYMGTSVLECVHEFVYLGNLTTRDNDCSAVQK